MRTISIKQLQKNICAELRDLPFAITRDGKEIAQVLVSTKDSQVTTKTPSNYQNLVSTKPQVSTAVSTKVTTKVTTEPKKIIKTVEDAQVVVNSLARKENQLGYCSFPFCHAPAYTIREDQLYCDTHK